MTDFFAALSEPRQPWIDQAELSEKFRQLSLTSHPDRTGPAATDETFVDVNEAYRILSDPKLRVQHLLHLMGHDPAGRSDVPETLLDLFTRISAFAAEVTPLLQRRQEAQNPLTVSLMQTQIVSAKRKAVELLDEAKRISSAAEERLQALNDDWEANLPGLADLYRLFAYLTRWIPQLEEWKFKLENG